MCKEKQEKEVMCECFVAGVRTMTRVGDGLWKCPRCGGFVVGMNEHTRKSMADALDVLDECDKYLDENNLNNIGNKSTLHMKMKGVLNKARN